MKKNIINNEKWKRKKARKGKLLVYFNNENKII